MAVDSRTISDPITPESVRSGFTPRLFGREILFFDSLDSTNKTLRRMAMRGAPEGTLVLAEEQTAGRGRLNRTWASPPGVGIYLSLLLRPPRLMIRPYLYTFLPAVAVARALRSVSGLPVFIHWPNDLMLRGKKIAGILTEIRSSGGQPREVIIGAGINVNHTPGDWPGSLKETATSLASASGRTFPRARLVQAFLREMEQGYAALRHDQGRILLESWKRLCPSQRGQPVSVSVGSAGEIRGTTCGIDEDGALLVERRNGGLERVAFGEVRRVRDQTQRET